MLTQASYTGGTGSLNTRDTSLLPDPVLAEEVTMLNHASCTEGTALMDTRDASLLIRKAILDWQFYQTQFYHLYGKTIPDWQFYQTGGRSTGRPPPWLQKLGRLLHIVITYLVHAAPTPSLGTAKSFAEMALMATAFENAIRPMMNRWKQHTKHDRALARQIHQSKYFCGYHDIWMIAFALSQNHGCFQYKSWMDFPVTYMTPIGRGKSIPCVRSYGSRNGWSLALSVSACLSQTDKYSVTSLCVFAKNIVRSWWTSDFQRGKARKLQYFTRNIYNGLYEEKEFFRRGFLRRVFKSYKLVMRHLPDDITAYELRSLTSEHGEIMSIDLWVEKNTKTAVIEYAAEENVKRAHEEFNGRRMTEWHMKLWCSIVR